MLLDDFHQFKKYDPENMLEKIDTLPEQLEKAWQLGHHQELPDFNKFQRILIAGMGGSAIGADLLVSFIANQCRLPVIVHRDYDLPAWAFGPETLVITSSHSGNTEESISAFESATKNRCSRIVITTGGKLAEMAKRSDVPLWLFPNEGQPRAAVGYSFGLLLSLFARLGYIDNPEEELSSSIKALRQAQTCLKADIPAISNPAKRMAGQLIGRYVAVIGPGFLAPVARRWKGQISEIAKAWAQFEFIPEANHNTLAGSHNPEEVLSKLAVLFLRSPADYPRNRLRIELTKKSFMLQGICTDIIDAGGDTLLANLWTLLHFGDYMAYYLAMAYQEDPTPVAAIESFKLDMKASG
jgi:glucose/mannose-6-phosphate isomerase